VRLKEWRLARLSGRPGFVFFRGDVRGAATLEAAFAAPSGRTPFDAVVNLAARSGVRPSLDAPDAYLSTNVEGTLRLLEKCRRTGVGKFVLASSSSLYGAGAALPFREDADTDRPLSPYAASKKAAEALSHAYHHLHGIDVTVFRYFSVYGPAGRPDMSPFRIVQAVSEARPITLYGDGSQRRDFTYVDDVARGTVAGLRPVGFGVFNLGHDEPICLLDAIRLVERLVGRKAEIVRAPPHPADVPATRADIGRARALLGWEPRVAFEEGMSRLVAWYRENRAWAAGIAAHG